MNKLIRMMTVAIGVATILAATAADSRELYSWNADSLNYVVDGAQSSCTDLKGRAVIDSSERHSGSGSIRYTLTDGQGDNGCDTREVADGGDIYDGGETYFRWWMKIGSNMNWGSDQKKAKIARMSRTNEEVPSYTTLYLLHNGFRWAGAFNETGSDNYINLVADLNPRDGACSSSARVGNLGSACTEWREYIFYFRRNTCPTCENGVARLYINGKLVDEQTGVAFGEFIPDDGVTAFKYNWGGVGAKLYPQMCPNGESCGTGGTIWIDDMSIATTWNSTQFSKSGDGGTGDVVRPNPPKALVIEN